MDGLPPISEEAFMQQVIALAKLCGFKVYHTRDSRRSTAGFPDLVLVHVRRCLFLIVETKRESGKLTTAQVEWLAALNAVGVDARLWRPSDWEEIERTLKGD